MRDFLVPIARSFAPAITGGLMAIGVETGDASIIAAGVVVAVPWAIEVTWAIITRKREAR